MGEEELGELIIQVFKMKIFFSIESFGDTYLWFGCFSKKNNFNLLYVLLRTVKVKGTFLRSLSFVWDF